MESQKLEKSTPLCHCVLEKKRLCSGFAGTYARRTLDVVEKQEKHCLSDDDHFVRRIPSMFWRPVRLKPAYEHMFLPKIRKSGTAKKGLIRDKLRIKLVPENLHPGVYTSATPTTIYTASTWLVVRPLFWRGALVIVAAPPNSTFVLRAAG